MISSDSIDDFVEEVSYAFERVPFYRKHLISAGVDPDDILFVEDVQTVPPTEKIHYRKNFPLGVVAEGYKLSDKSLVKSQSSGTSGERLITYEVGMLLMERAIECSRLNAAVEKAFTRSPRKICRYAAPNCSDVECANPNSTTEDRILDDGTLVLPVYHDLLTTSDQLIETALQEVCDYQPDLYYVDPTHFAFLLRQAVLRGKVLPYAPIVTTYTSTNDLNRSQINKIVQLFGHDEASCAELVSSSEMGWIAMECEHGSLHLNTNSFFMELLDGERYVNEGEIGELLITSLDKGAIPHIRYRTGDIFKYIGRECSCGRAQPVVEMHGRISNLIQFNAGKSITPSEIFKTIGSHDWLDIFQLEFSGQDYAMGKLRLIVNDRYSDGDELKPIGELDKLFGGNVALTCEQVSYIATDRSGKFQPVKYTNL